MNLDGKVQSFNILTYENLSLENIENQMSTHAPKVIFAPKKENIEIVQFNKIYIKGN